MSEERGVRGAAWTRALLRCGVLGPALFMLIVLLLGVSRPGYDALRHPVSSFAIGERGWLQNANFLLVGAALVVCATGLRRALRSGPGRLWGPLLIGLAGVGLFGAGLCTTDPAFGYPTDAPLALAQYTLWGRLHSAFSLLLFLGLPPACFILCRRFADERCRGWAAYSLLSGLGMLVAFVAASAGFTQDPRLVGVAGVFQRLSIALGLLWVAALAARLLGASAE